MWSGVGFVHDLDQVSESVVCFSSFTDFSTGVTLSIATLFSMPLTSMTNLCHLNSINLFGP